LFSNNNFYEREFNKYNDYKDVNLSRQQASQINNQVLSYLKGETALLPDVFNEREKEHLKDVKKVIRYCLYAWFILLFVFLYLFFTIKHYSRKTAYKSLIVGGFFTILSILFIFLISKLNFIALFTAFHKPLFQGSTWLFSSTDAIINIYPQVFFYDFLFTLIVYSFLVAIGFMVVGYFGKKQLR